VTDIYKLLGRVTTIGRVGISSRFLGFHSNINSLNDIIRHNVDCKKVHGYGNSTRVFQYQGVIEQVVYRIDLIHRSYTNGHI
jgi:hypothetical protein